jgi:hypothetical protein
VFGYLIIPPAILSGVLGLVWFSVIEHFDPLMTADLRSGLEALKGNLINFVFGALILGLTSMYIAALLRLLIHLVIPFHHRCLFVHRVIPFHPSINPHRHHM